MHTFRSTNGTLFRFNSDLSGAVELVLPQSGSITTSVSGQTLLEFVADAVRRQRIAALEQATTEELLGLPSRSESTPESASASKSVSDSVELKRVLAELLVQCVDVREDSSSSIQVAMQDAAKILGLQPPPSRRSSATYDRIWWQHTQQLLQELA